MSAFVVLLSRSEAPAASCDADALMARLRHRGPDGSRIAHRGWAALGHHHLWATPEEVGEEQPLRDPHSGAEVVFDGRLDNRPELLSALAPEPLGGAATVSDAALVLAAWARWRERCFEHLLGPFAAAILDPEQRRLVCGRDPLGDRTLFYAAAPDLVAVASEAWALLAHPSLSSRCNETTLACFFAVRAPVPGETFFADVRELPPGCLLLADGRHLEVRRHWSPAVAGRQPSRPDREHVERFRHLLADSVRCRLRLVGRPAVLMSGGLDSTSVAALAAEELAATGAQDPLCAISWVFDELAAADEREFMTAVGRRHGLDAVHIRGDRLWPLSDPPTWPVNPNAPLEGLYRRLTNAAYRAAREAGATTLLNGEYGDELFTGDAHWLQDLLAEGRLATAVAELGDELAHFGDDWAAGSSWLRASLARALGWRGRRPPAGAWLTPEGREMASASDTPTTWLPGSRRPEQLTTVLDPDKARAASLEVSAASRFGVDVRRPYRDRRLVEHALSMPAHLLARKGWGKWVLREAMSGLLPEAVRHRTRYSTLLPLAHRGLVEREHRTVARLLHGQDALWPRFVRREWLLGHLPTVLSVDGIESVVVWRCVCAELWRQRLEAAPRAPG